jgi:hypothetical protein
VFAGGVNDPSEYMSTKLGDDSTVVSCAYAIDTYHGYDDAPRTLCIRP